MMLYNLSEVFTRRMEPECKCTRVVPPADPGVQLNESFASSINLIGCLRLATSPPPPPFGIIAITGVLAREHGESYVVCEGDPTDWCSSRDGTPGGPTPNQWRYDPMTL